MAVALHAGAGNGQTIWSALSLNGAFCGGIRTDYVYIGFNGLTLNGDHKWIGINTRRTLIIRLIAKRDVMRRVRLVRIGILTRRTFVARASTHHKSSYL